LIDQEVELDRLLDRQIAGLGAFENLVDVCRPSAPLVGSIRPIGEKPTLFDIFPLGVASRTSARGDHG